MIRTLDRFVPATALALVVACSSPRTAPSAAPASGATPAQAATPAAGATPAQAAAPAQDFQSEFHVEAGDWASQGKNDFFVLEPRYQLVLKDKLGKQQLVITVLDETRKIDGVETRVVEERETVDGQPKEISRNFFAISKRTNDVYYFGEEVDIYKKGRITSHEGGWLSGVGGAKFGLAMPGTVRVGAKYFQEHAPGAAMDRFEIVSMEKAIDTPAGHFEHCLETEETTPLEPGNEESKLYARGIGLVQDEELLLAWHGMGERGH